MSIENCSDAPDALFSLIEENKIFSRQSREALKVGKVPTIIFNVFLDLTTKDLFENKI